MCNQVNRSGDNSKDSYSVQEEGACHSMQGHMRKHQGWPGGRKRQWETTDNSLDCGFCGKGKAG